MGRGERPCLERNRTGGSGGLPGESSGVGFGGSDLGGPGESTRTRPLRLNRGKGLRGPTSWINTTTYKTRWTDSIRQQTASAYINAEQLQDTIRKRMNCLSQILQILQTDINLLSAEGDGISLYRSESGGGADDNQP